MKDYLSTVLSPRKGVRIKRDEGMSVSNRIVRRGTKKSGDPKYVRRKRTLLKLSQKDFTIEDIVS